VEPIDWNTALSGDTPIWRPVRKHKRRMGQFVCGPIPLAWLQEACKARAAELSIYLWYKAGILGKGALIALRHGELAAFGLGRFAVRRQFQSLVGAQLVKPVVVPGKCKAVRIELRQSPPTKHD
jgi:hypothetical protein